jgi:hypothetical protein
MCSSSGCMMTRSRCLKTLNLGYLMKLDPNVPK